MIPRSILSRIANGPLPAFVYDPAVVRRRAAAAAALLDRYYYPIKACPAERVVRAAIEAGGGIDLCSMGDVKLARSIDCSPSHWSFTSPHVTADVIRELVNDGEPLFDADSDVQIRQWRAAGGSKCGMRISMVAADSAYGVKFGVPVADVGRLISAARGDGVDVVGLHLHESHVSRTPVEMVTRLETVLAGISAEVLHNCHYVNIGGGWPLESGWPVDEDRMRAALDHLRARLIARGFSGILSGEPGEWVVGPAGYWAATVSAVKRHPLDHHRFVVVLDTATPVPCKPSAAPFLLLRDGEVMHAEVPLAKHDIYGSANTGMDSIGLDVALPTVEQGDVLVSLCQGAYARSLTGTFNERPLPAVLICDS